MLICDLLRDSARRYPHKVATIYQGERLTYFELDRISDDVALRVIQLGVRIGDRVALFLANSPEYVASFFGALKAGAAIVPLDTQTVAREFLQYIEDCIPKLIVTDQVHASFVRQSLSSVPNPPLVLTVDEALRRAGGDGSGLSTLSRISVSEHDLAMIVYTSGTTGKPKGVMLSHANLIANAESIVQYLHLEPDDITMVVLPFTHSYGISVLTTRIKAGGTLVIDNRFAYPNAILQAMAQHEVSGFDGVPYHYAVLLRKSILRRMQLPRLKYVTQAGGALAPAMIEEFIELLPHVRFYVMYGQTEASARLSYLEPEMLRRKMGSVGKAIPGVELDILDEQGRSVAPGETGEIVARGKNIMLGYWRAPRETALVLRDGRLFTGDLARRDEDGFIYIVGRGKEMIKVGGHRVSPLEVEEVVMQLPGVAECAAIGIPDEIMGESIKLVVVPAGSETLSEKDIISYCKQNLAPYKVPRWVEKCASLPKTATGKIKRAELKAMQLDQQLVRHGS